MIGLGARKLNRAAIPFVCHFRGKGRHRQSERAQAERRSLQNDITEEFMCD